MLVFIVWIAFILLEQKTNLSLKERVCKNKDFCAIEMPSQKYILQFNQYMESVKYADLPSLMKKIDGCANNSEKSSANEIGEHITCRYSMSTIWAFHHIENKHTLCCGKAFTKLYEFWRSILI